MSNRIAFLPDSVSAAAAAPLFTILSVLYLLPSMAIVCGGVAVNRPEIRSGDVYFERPAAMVLSVDRNGDVHVGQAIVRNDDLRRFLEEQRGVSSWPLEIAADRTLKWGAVRSAFEAARDAGYAEVYLFGPYESIASLPRA